MKIVITGGLGFIGSALARSLVAAGHEVTIIDNLSAQIHGAVPRVNVPEGVQVARLDLRQVIDHAEILDGSDAVYHLAAETGTAQSMYKIADYVSVNELGTAALLEAIARCSRRPASVVLTSSRSVYGEGAYEAVDTPGTLVQPASRSKEQMLAGQWEPLDASGRALRPLPTPESLPYAPGSIYAATKASQELLLNAAASALGFRSTILRLQNVYGEGQSLQNPYTGIISIFFNRARQGLEIPIYEDGKESRDFVHVSDVVCALQAALHAELPRGQVLNVGSGEGVAVAQLAKDLIGVSGCNVATRVTGQFRVGDIRHCYADLTQAKRLLGYAPRISLREGLSRFCAWASAQPPHEDRLERATEELRKKGLTN